MLVKSVLSTKPSAELSYQVANPLRVASNPVPAIAQYELPAWIDTDDYIPLSNGGYASKLDDTYANDDTQVNLFISFTEDDPLVKVETVVTLNGHVFSQTSAGDGVTPFPIATAAQGNPTPGLGSHVVNVDRKYPGDWCVITSLIHASGRVVVHEHCYTVTGTATIADAELYIGGLPVPEYKDDWQQIADLHGASSPNKRDAAQAKADAAPERPPAPTATTHPFLFPVSEATLPAELVTAKQIATTGTTAGSTGITLFESNPGTAGALAELNHYGAIVESWSLLSQSTTNDNLRRVASLNTQYMSVFLDGSIAAHNGQESYANADFNWQTVEQYSAWMLKQPANSLVDVRTWDVDLGRPK